LHETLPHGNRLVQDGHLGYKTYRCPKNSDRLDIVGKIGENLALEPSSHYEGAEAISPISARGRVIALLLAMT
jgi:hypothetical protein